MKSMLQQAKLFFNVSTSCYHAHYGLYHTVVKGPYEHFKKINDSRLSLLPEHEDCVRILMMADTFFSRSEVHKIQGRLKNIVWRIILKKNEFEYVATVHPAAAKVSWVLASLRSACDPRLSDCRGSLVWNMSAVHCVTRSQRCQESQRSATSRMGNLYPTPRFCILYSIFSASHVGSASLCQSL